MIIIYLYIPCYSSTIHVHALLLSIYMYNFQIINNVQSKRPSYVPVFFELSEIY